MGRVNDDNWLDEALDKAIHADGTQPDFETWKARHPETVETLTAQTPATKTIRINAWFIRLAAAAVIAIAAIVGITQFTDNTPERFHAHPIAIQETLTGPTTRAFPDGSIVKLAAGAQIHVDGTTGKRGFEHLAGVIDVTVAKGQGEFIVTTPYGDVKALGTEFTLELVDETADGGEKVEMLTVEVTKGTVEVSNDQGKTTLEASQKALVAKDTAPYDFQQDEALPDQLKERIEGMLDAFAAGDAAAWAVNFNINYVFKLGKGQVEYDPLLFGGSEGDARRLRERLKDIESPEQLSQVFLGTINITEPIKIYVASVELSNDGRHARAHCIRRKSERSMTITTPQWHYFDNDWWQIDD